MAAVFKWVITALKTGAYTAALGEIVRGDPSGGTFDVTSPVVTSAHAGRQWKLHNQSASTTALRAMPDAGHTVNGTTSYSITTARKTITLIYDGVSDWIVED